MRVGRPSVMPTAQGSGLKIPAVCLNGYGKGRSNRKSTVEGISVRGDLRIMVRKKSSVSTADSHHAFENSIHFIINRITKNPGTYLSCENQGLNMLFNLILSNSHPFGEVL